MSKSCSVEVIASNVGVFWQMVLLWFDSSHVHRVTRFVCFVFSDDNNFHNVENLIQCISNLLCYNRILYILLYVIARNVNQKQKQKHRLNVCFLKPSTPLQCYGVWSACERRIFLPALDPAGVLIGHLT